MDSGTSVKYFLEDKTGGIQKMPCVSFCCQDIGLDCVFEATETTEHLLLRKFIEHAELSHNMPVLSADVLFRIKNAIRK
jgi:predicted small metal-binding protein